MMTRNHGLRRPPDKSEQSREDSEEAIYQLASIVESSGDAIFTETLQGMLTTWNSSAEKLFGYAKGEMIGQPVSLLVPPDRQEELPYKVERTTVGEAVKNYETMRLRKDGSSIEVSLTVSPIRNPKGRIIGNSTIAHDITERKQEEVIQESSRQKNAILESITDAFFALDTSWNITYANKQAETFMLMKRGELVGRTYWEVFPETDGSPFYRQYHKAMAEGVTVEFEEFYPPHHTWYEVHVYPSSSGLAVYLRDVNERRRGVEALRQSEENFRLLADAMPQIIWTARPDGWRDYYNQKWFEYTGITFEQAQGWGWEAVLHPDDLQKGIDVWKRSVATGESYSIEYRFKAAADGVYRWKLGRALPVRDDRGQIIKWFGTCTDIDDQKRTEEVLRLSKAQLQDQARDLEMHSGELGRANTELRRQRDELTTLNADLVQANQVRDQFLATMSHELRTPLASIIGFSEMLLDDAQETDWNHEQQNDLERILKNSEHLLGLINDVLDLAKIEAGRMLVNYSQVDVRELLTSVVEETQSMAIAQHLLLRAEVAEGVASLESNPLKLRQILLNLVSNALKFTEQGEVTVSARRVISSEQGADQLALAVKDSGMGIPADMQERIFEAFYQADGSYTRKFGGTGLGLSIVSQLTTLLGGTIEVISAPGQGSTFTVLLPIKAVQQNVVQDTPRLHPAQQSEASMLSPSSHKLVPARPPEFLEDSGKLEATDEQHSLILAVDDNPDVIALIKAALRDTPYNVVEVQDPLKVMELVQELQPCAITLDVMMPELNGWQLLHQLKDNPVTASVPVILLTVLAEQATGYVLGADDYVIKPFKKDDLRHTLQRVIEAKKGPSGASR